MGEVLSFASAHLPRFVRGGLRQVSLLFTTAAIAKLPWYVRREAEEAHKRNGCGAPNDPPPIASLLTLDTGEPPAVKIQGVAEGPRRAARP